MTVVVASWFTDAQLLDALRAPGVHRVHPGRPHGHGMTSGPGSVPEAPPSPALGD